MGRAPCCEKVGLKKGRWTAEEDEILIKYIQAKGEGSWRSLPKNAGLKRCGKSCRLRWINYLRADLKRGNITAEEEGIIIKLHNSLGNRWSLIAGHLPGRTDNEIKNYWNSHLSRRIDTYRRPCGELPSPRTLMELAAKLSGGCKKKGSGAQRNNPKTTSKTKVPANTKETATSKKPKIADSRRNGTNTSEKSDLTSSEVAELDDQPVSKDKVLQTDLEREESEYLTSEFLGHNENTEIFMLSPDEATEIIRTGVLNDEGGEEEEELEIDEFFFDDVMSDNLQCPDAILGSTQEIRDGVMDINDNNQHCDQEILLLNMDSPSFKESKSDDRENGVLSSSLNGENGSTHLYCSPPLITSCFEEDDWGKWDWDSSFECHKDWAVGEAENLELLSCLWDIRDHSSETQMVEY